MLVHPRSTFISSLDGRTVLDPSIRLSDTNPHVRHAPLEFEPVGPTPGFGDVEETTARPGERRNR